MTPTTVPGLEATIRAAIEGITPRTAYQASTWSAYERRGENRRNEPAGAAPKLGSTRSRRFRLTFNAQPYREGAVWESGAVETDVELIVTVDYAGTATDQATIEQVVADDWHQLRDELCALKGQASGIMLVSHGSRPELAGPREAPDVSCFALPFVVRYLQQTRQVI
jgi:hypothetical protein